jgi:hypothetical protein
VDAPLEDGAIAAPLTRTLVIARVVANADLPPRVRERAVGAEPPPRLRERAIGAEQPA